MIYLYFLANAIILVLLMHQAAARRQLCDRGCAETSARQRLRADMCATAAAQTSA